METIPKAKIKVHATLSYASSAVSIPFEAMTIRERIDLMADKHPNEVAYTFNQNNGLELTYSDLKRRCYILARNFLSLGLTRGDRVAFLLPNTHELLLSYYACSFAGLVSVPLDADYGPSELEYMLNKTEPSAVVIYNCEQYRTLIDELFGEVKQQSRDTFKSAKFQKLRHVIVLDDVNQTSGKDFKAAWNYKDLASKLLNKQAEQVQFPYVDVDDLFAILFTVI